MSQKPSAGKLLFRSLCSFWKWWHTVSTLNCMLTHSTEIASVYSCYLPTFASVLISVSLYRRIPDLPSSLVLLSVVDVCVRDKEKKAFCSLWLRLGRDIRTEGLWNMLVDDFFLSMTKTRRHAILLTRKDETNLFIFPNAAVPFPVLHVWYQDYTAAHNGHSQDKRNKVIFGLRKKNKCFALSEGK